MSVANGEYTRCKKYRCGCGSVQSTRQEFLCHQVIQHANDFQVFQCNECDYTTHLEEKMKSHVETGHSRPAKTVPSSMTPAAYARRDLAETMSRELLASRDADSFRRLLPRSNSRRADGFSAILEERQWLPDSPDDRSSSYGDDWAGVADPADAAAAFRGSPLDEPQAERSTANAYHPLAATDEYRPSCGDKQHYYRCEQEAPLDLSSKAAVVSCRQATMPSYHQCAASALIEQAERSEADRAAAVASEAIFVGSFPAGGDVNTTGRNAVVRPEEARGTATSQHAATACCSSSTEKQRQSWQEVAPLVPIRINPTGAGPTKSGIAAIASVNLKPYSREVVSTAEGNRSSTVDPTANADATKQLCYGARQTPPGCAESPQFDRRRDPTTRPCGCTTKFRPLPTASATTHWSAAAVTACACDSPARSVTSTETVYSQNECACCLQSGRTAGIKEAPEEPDIYIVSVSEAQSYAAAAPASVAEDTESVQTAAVEKRLESQQPAFLSAPSASLPNDRPAGLALGNEEAREIDQTPPTLSVCSSERSPGGLAAAAASAIPSSAQNVVEPGGTRRKRTALQRAGGSKSNDRGAGGATALRGQHWQCGLRRAQSAPYTFVCPWCNWYAHRLNLLKRHAAGHHAKEYFSINSVDFAVLVRALSSTASEAERSRSARAAVRVGGAAAVGDFLNAAKLWEHSADDVRGSARPEGRASRGVRSRAATAASTAPEREAAEAGGTEPAAAGEERGAKSKDSSSPLSSAGGRGHVLPRGCYGSATGRAIASMDVAERKPGAGQWAGRLNGLIVKIPRSEERGCRLANNLGDRRLSADVGAAPSGSERPVGSGILAGDDAPKTKATQETASRKRRTSQTPGGAAEREDAHTAIPNRAALSAAAAAGSPAADSVSASSQAHKICKDELVAVILRDLASTRGAAGHAGARKQFGIPNFKRK